MVVGPGAQVVRSGLRRSAIVAVVASAIGAVIAITPGHRGWFDVGVYHGAVTYWIRDGGDLYSYLRPGSIYGFTYPPFAAICMLPVAYVGWHPAIAINLALTVAASAFLLFFLVDPIARRQGWPRWYAFGLAACAFAALNPVRDTVSFGQINLLLVAAVYADLWLIGRRSRLAGIGIGLAAAIKLTPGIFIGYLLVTRQWRAAATAALTALVATLLAAALAPDATRAYFTDALWNTGRIGALDYVSNQSLLGLVARLNPAAPNKLLWLSLVAGVLAGWLWRSAQARRVGDHHAGFATTGLVSCLISPITWVHHLAWLVPALVVLADAGLPPASARARRTALRAGITSYAVLVSSVVWLWSQDHGGLIGLIGADSYLLVTVLLLVAVRAAPPSRDVHRPVPSPRRPPRSPSSSPPRAPASGPGEPAAIPWRPASSAATAGR
jgi:alpha-1,2-mannosyltransferase